MTQVVLALPLKKWTYYYTKNMGEEYFQDYRNDGFLIFSRTSKNVKCQIAQSHSLSLSVKSWMDFKIEQLENRYWQSVILA